MDEQAFVARVRKAVARTAPPAGQLLNDHIKVMRAHGGDVAAEGQPEPAPAAPAYLGEMLGLPDPADQNGLAEHWATEFAKLGGRVALAEAPEQAATAITEMVAVVLAQRGGYCVITAHPLLTQWRVEQALSAAGLPVQVYRSAADRSMLAEASVGVTVASAAIAETGTLVIESHTGQGRTTSLLPPVSIGVVPPGVLVPGVAGWLAGRGARFQSGEEMPSSTVFATGPSRSADIAGDLALGVHGPGEVYAVLVSGSQADSAGPVGQTSVAD